MTERPPKLTYLWLLQPDSTTEIPLVREFVKNFDGIEELLGLSDNVGYQSTPPDDLSELKPVLVRWLKMDLDLKDFHIHHLLYGAGDFFLPNDKYIQDQVKYMAVIRDPWTSRCDLDRWARSYSLLMKIIQSHKYNINVIRHEKVIDDPGSVVADLIKWIPELHDLDYTLLERDRVPPDCFVEYKLLKLKEKGSLMMFNKVAKYFGYRTTEEMD